MSFSGNAVVFSGVGSPLTVQQISTPHPQRDEIAVATELAGVCGTDLHRLAGDMEDPSFPITFGHEGVGRVIALGEDAVHDSADTPLAVGDRVYWSPMAPCGECVVCADLDHPTRCPQALAQWPTSADLPSAAAFREYATLSARTLKLRIPDGATAEAIIALGCALPTVAAGFRRLGRVPAQVLVQGAGPVGLAATLMAHLAGAESVTVIGAGGPGLVSARRLGATRTIALEDTTRKSRADLIRNRKNCDGPQLIVEAAGSVTAFDEGLELLGMSGVYLILGLFSGSHRTQVDPVRLNNLNQRIIGSLGYSLVDFQTALRIASEHGHAMELPQLITQRFPLARTQEAIHASSQPLSVKTVIEMK